MRGINEGAGKSYSSYRPYSLLFGQIRRFLRVPYNGYVPNRA